jgi:hypothetical protein
MLNAGRRCGYRSGRRDIRLARHRGLRHVEPTSGWSNGIVASTTNWASFSEIAFAFQVTPRLLLNGLIFAAAMGVLGGFVPARRASKLQVVEAIRT